MRVYNRSIKVIIGEDGGTGIEIENVMIEIDINKTISGTPNDGVVSMYNLSDNTENRIKEKGKRARIFAGYDGKPILIHDGDIRRVERSRKGLDRVTTIIIGGNLKKLSDAVFDKSYSGSVPVRQVVLDSIPSFGGITAVDLDQIPNSAVVYDFSFTGKTGVMLDKILRPFNVQWYESDNYIRFSLGSQATEKQIVLNKNTGLIGSPTVTEKGIAFKSVLNGLMSLKMKIKIESYAVNGVYKITELTHGGDNRDGAFETTGAAVAI